MHNEKVHTFFWYVSRASIIIPLIVIGLALILKIDQVKNSKNKEQSGMPIVITPKLKPPTPIPEEIKPNSINLTKSQKCVIMNSAGAVMSVYISSGNYYAQYAAASTKSSGNILIKGDCVYKWQSGASTGEQTCGVTNYIKALTLLSDNGMLDKKNFTEAVVRFGNDSKLVSSFAGSDPVCEEQKISEEIFNGEKGIKFTKKNLVTPSPTVIQKK